MFFILRALDPNGSRWSGQVAFPGGHVEEGETDEDAVRRECKEEVGFDLNKTCRFLGETRPRVVQRNGGNLVVCCHVYEMVKEENQNQESPALPASEKEGVTGDEVICTPRVSLESPIRPSTTSHLVINCAVPSNEHNEPQRTSSFSPKSSPNRKIKSQSPVASPASRFLCSPPATINMLDMLPRPISALTTTRFSMLPHSKKCAVR